MKHKRLTAALNANLLLALTLLLCCGNDYVLTHCPALLYGALAYALASALLLSFFSKFTF